MSLELRTNMSIKDEVQPALGFMRGVNHHTSGSEPATSQGGEEERCCGQTGTFWLSPWKNVLAEAAAGFGVSLLMWSHGNAPRITTGNRLLMDPLHQTKLLPPSCWLGLSGPCPCPFACPAPSILAGLYEQQWDHSESHGKLCSHLTIPVPIQRISPDLHSPIVLPQKLQLAVKQGK